MPLANAAERRDNMISGDEVRAREVSWAREPTSMDRQRRQQDRLKETPHRDLSAVVQHRNRILSFVVVARRPCLLYIEPILAECGLLTGRFRMSAQTTSVVPPGIEAAAVVCRARPTARTGYPARSAISPLP